MWHQEGNATSRCGQSTQGFQGGNCPNRDRVFLWGTFFYEGLCHIEPCQKWKCCSFFLRRGRCRCCRCLHLASTTPAQGMVFGRYDYILCSGTLKLGCLDSKSSSAACDLLWCWKSSSTSLSLGRDGNRAYFLAYCENSWDYACEGWAQLLKSAQ